MSLGDSLGLRRLGLLTVALFLFTHAADAQLRIVTYNTAGGPRTGLDQVLRAIGQEARNGFAKPIDVLILQEQTSSATTTQSIVNILDAIHGPGRYARATLDGQTSGGGRPGLIYNTNTVQLVDQISFGQVNTSAQARQTLRYQLRPVGYQASADFYVYSNHYKAGTTTTDRNRRQVEAAAVRANADLLGNGAPIIYAGDFNIRSSSEQSYQTLLGPGAGQAWDPLNASGTWYNNAQFKAIHTQSPAVNPESGLTGGGVDDRFDFQLLTAEMLDGRGVDYIGGSYRAFGNNGTHVFQGDIFSGSGAESGVLHALADVSDHLPVVADYQIPAVLGSLVERPRTKPFQVGERAALQGFVFNAADVLSSLGADRLDFQVSVTGGLLGSGQGTSLANSDPSLFQVTLDTTIAGTRTGSVVITSNSPGVPNGRVEIPLTWVVEANAIGLPAEEAGIGSTMLATNGIIESTGFWGFDERGLASLNTSDTLLWREDLAGWHDTLVKHSLTGLLPVPEPAGWIGVTLLLLIGVGGRPLLGPRIRRGNPMDART